MKHQTKVSTQQEAREAQQAGQQQSQETAAREFTTPEEMLRHDALHIPVPPTIAHRLQQSLEKGGEPPRSFWQRLFGG